MLYFHAEEWLDHPKGREAICKSPVEMSRSHPECVGSEVMIDGNRWDCIGVHCHMPGVPIRVGEVIGLLVTRHSATDNP